MRRPARIAETLREGVTQIVGYELEDPRVLGVTITDVRVAPNNRDARIFFTVTGTEEEARDALAALRSAAPFVRRHISLFYDMPRVPQLHFVRDTVEERAARVNDLLMNLKQSDAGDEQAGVGADAQSAGGTTEVRESIAEGDAPPDEAGEIRARSETE